MLLGDDVCFGVICRQVGGGVGLRVSPPQDVARQGLGDGRAGRGCVAEARTSVSSGVQRGAFERGRLCADLGGPDACSRSLRSVLTFLVDSPLAMAGASEANGSDKPFTFVDQPNCHKSRQFG